VRGVVTSVQAGVSSTLTANLGLALAPGDTVHLMTSRAQIPVGAATKEANAQNSLNDLVFDEEVSKFKSPKSPVLGLECP
jgi:hypothetical protein